MLIKLKWKGNALFLLGSLAILCLTLWYWLMPTHIKFAAGKKEGESYKFALIFKELVEQNTFPRIHVEVIETDGTQINLEKLSSQQADLGVAQADLLAMPDHVRQQLDLKPVDLSATRLIASLFPDAYQLIVRQDAGIKKVNDLRGKRIIMPPGKGGQIQSFYFLTEHYGLSKQDYQFVNVTSDNVTSDNVTSDNVTSDNEITAFCQGEAQAIFLVRAIGHKEIRRLLTECPQVNPKLIAIDQAGALKIKNPYIEESVIPKGAYRGENPIPGNDMEPNKQLATVQVQRLLLTHKNVNPDVIRRLTEVLYEYRQDFIQKMELPLAAYITPPQETKVDVVATHLGAKWYYNREQPSWLEQNSGSLEVLLGVMIPIAGWFWWLLQQLEQARKDKADDYIREVTALMDAQDFLHGLVELETNPSQLRETDTLSKNPQVNLAIDKIAKILVEKYDAEIAKEKGVVSQESLVSFGRTLRKVVQALEQSQVELANYIFVQAPDRAVKVGINRQKRQSRKKFFSAIIGFDLNLPFLGNEKPPVINHLVYQTTLEKARTPGNSPVTQNSTLDQQFLLRETRLIRQDLEVIFKRAVDAMVEERISQNSFQAFRAIWQIAIDDVDRVIRDQPNLN